MPAPLYLASRSPRRKELLEQAGIEFRVYVPKEEELPAPKSLKDLGPGRLVRRIAAAKAKAAYRELKGQGIKRGLVLSADTLVFLEGMVLGKPANEAEARSMLRKLSGNWHQVCTGVTCLSFDSGSGHAKTIHVSTRVKFFPLRKEWIEWYVATGEPMDKAGAYGAQAKGSAFLERFDGSYTNVVGLPLGETLALFEDVSGESRATFQKNL